jgi:hypothetical protein
MFNISIPRMQLFTSLAAFAFLTALVSSGCATRIRQHNLPCHNRTVADVVRATTSTLVMNGFRITHSDTIVGLIQAQTDESRNVWTGIVEQRVWQVALRPNLNNVGEVTAGNSLSLAPPTDKQPLYLVATAKVVGRTQNAFGATLSTSEEYYGDHVHEDWTWYWDVRRGLEQVCGATAVVTVKKQH